MASHEQPMGAALPGWSPRPAPPRTPMQGRFCRLEPLDAKAHAADLFAAYSLDAEGRNWTYLSVAPFPDLLSYQGWLQKMEASTDPLVFTVVSTETGKAQGIATYLRIDRANGVIEVGGINFSPLLQRTPAATEAMALMMQRVFDELGYRRYEWKCDTLNAPSRTAAVRLGFQYEGVFRQAVVYKGRNRDTAWYSIIDTEWPRLKAGFQRWLAEDNFDSAGRQRNNLRDCMK